MPAWASYLWYQFVFWVSMIGLTLGQSLRIRGRQNIPRQGACLVIANHQSLLDPFLVGLASPRPLCFLARKTLFRGPLGWFIRSCNAMPIDHEHLGKEGLQTVLALLAAGKPVVVYPEGTRTPDGALHALKPGIYLLVKRAKVAVVTMGIAGAHDAWPRTQPMPMPAPVFLPATVRTVAVSVGEPVPAKRFEGLEREEVLDLLFQELKEVTEQAEGLRRK